MTLALCRLIIEMVNKTISTVKTKPATGNPPAKNIH